MRLRAPALTGLAVLLLAGALMVVGQSARAHSGSTRARVTNTVRATRRRRATDDLHARAAAPRGVAPVLILHGPRDRREVALTFDADMTPSMLARLRAHRVAGWYDASIVRSLRTTRTPATIFLTGLWTRTYPAVVRSLARDPLFELENHSVDHAAWGRLCYGLAVVDTEAAKRWEVVAAARTITAVAGVRPRFFRFPGGCHSSADLAIVAQAGEETVGWDVVSGDAFQPDPAAVMRAVLAQVRPGSIVVMHLMGAPNAPATATALRTIVPALRARGYHFVTVEKLLRK